MNIKRPLFKAIGKQTQKVLPVLILLLFVFNAAYSARTVTAISVGSQTGTATFGTGTSVTYTITLTRGGNNATGSDAISISAWSPSTPTGVTATFSPASPYNCNLVTTVTLTLTTTAATVAGAYTFTVKNIDANGGGTSTSTGTLTLLPTTPTISGGGSGCAGGITLTASGGSPSGGTYNWYNVSTGGSVLATGTTYPPTAAGTYYASYTSSSVEGARSSGTAVTLTGGPIISTAPTSPTSGLYLSYPFTGNTTDASGNSNNGTIRGTVTATADRYNASNSAYKFNGSTGYISTATGIAAPGPQNLSISVWFNTSTAGGMLVGYSASQTGLGSQYDRHIYMDNSGYVYFGLYATSTGTANTIVSTSAYADGTWHHAVATCSTTSGSCLYIDGELQSSSSTMTAPETYTGNGYWRVGYNNLAGWTNPPTDYYFTGSLDDIAVYNTAISASQVYTLYGAGSAPTCANSTLALQVNTVSGDTYSWTGPNSFTSTSQNPTVSTSATTAMAGTYTCTVTSPGGCTSSIDVTAVVNAAPTSAFTASSSVIIGANATITYSGTYSASNTYTWNFNGGTIASGSGVGPYTVNWSTSGSKTVTLTVTNSGGCSSTSTQTVTVGSYGNYAFSDPITLNSASLGITSNLTNFPALLSIQDNNLIISGACTDKVYYPNGPNYDFAFYDNTTGAECYYQVESYNQTTGTLLVWVQIPTLTYATNKSITFYYGSTSPSTTHNTAFYQNTWASDYKGVFHFNESSYSGSVTDGSSGAHTGTTSGMTSADLVTGKIGTAYSFNGSSKKITFGSIPITGTFTLSAWVKLAAINIDQKVMTNQSAAGNSSGGYKLGVYTNNYPETESGTAGDRGSTPFPTAFTTGTWHYIQGVYTGSTLSTYVDGSAYEVLSTTNNPSGTNPFYIGVGEGGTQYYFNGIIDEARVSSTAKSADWIKAEYADQNNPTTFTTVGSTSTNSTNAATISGALTYTWTGSTSTDPTVASNWNNTTAGTTSQLPAFDGSATLVIPAGLTNYPSLTADASLYGLTIASGASLNLNGHTLSVGCNIYNSSGGQILYGSTLTSGITWNGSASTQTYTGSSTSNTAQLGNMTINNSAAGTVTLSGGPVDIYNTLTITKGNLVIGSSPAALTLKSTAAQTASVAAIPAAYSITGNVTAERFITGGNTYLGGKWIYRNYRLMSSPVNEGVNSGNYPYSLNYLGASTIITGCTSSYATYSGNPSLYLYNEAYTPSNFSFTSGNFIGVSNINNTAASGHITTTDAAHPSANVYAGDGFMMYFRGNNINNLTGSPSKTSAPYVAPENVIFSTTGNLNQGTYSVVSWTGAAGLMYTTSNAGNSSVRGFNLVGNPYPSSIDWSTFSNSSSSAAIYGLHVNPTIYILNPVTSNFDTYNATTNIATGSASKIISSGQGFFVQANAASPTLTFTENAKTSTQVSGSNLLLGTPDAQSAYNSYLRMKLVTDTLNNDEIVIGFNSTSSVKFNGAEDAQFMPGSGSAQSIAALSADSVSTAVKWVPLPKSALSQAIRLNVSAKASGTYTLIRTDFKAIPKLYQVWLMDNYKKDSLDIRNNTTYTFDISHSDTASFGNNRFKVVVRQDPALMVHLLNFIANKITGGAQIIWVTENEANYTNFTVERSIDGGKTYTVLGGAASNDLGTYSYLDKSPVTGANLYRLQIVDLNGTISYSNIATVMYGKTTSLVKTGIVVYPNPASTIINLAIAPGFNSNTGSSQGSTTTYEVQIANILGATVIKTTTSQQSWQSNISALMPGTYVINVTNAKDNSAVGQTTFIKL
ncbi:DUF2341 domain-containing protein [Mucilaginibacter gotjawali]|uniref:Uncharacterized protein n=1 Tax=Mucilaginibacter gotjawali TaxID=1550579 RepID=A0A839SA92_9SPHI|nr:DUF2341 domain-containing protein [Mucilaginibacter gotjawali]MBB3054945.1 hypothetical protein [Mucilaginibacter gotjawali]